MIQAITVGFFSGILLSLGFGSVFFALIQTSIDHGYKAGIKIASGVLIGDFLLIALAIWGTSFLPNIPDFELYSRLIGFVLLVGLGLAQFRKSGGFSHKAAEVRLVAYIYFIAKGFVLNVINPVNFFAWVILSASLKTYQFTLFEEMTALGVCLFMIFVCESGMALFAHKIKQRLSDNTVSYIKKGSGIVFLGIAGKLLWDLLVNNL